MLAALAALLIHAGRFAEAERRFWDAGNRRSEGIALGALATVCHHTGRPAEAEACRERGTGMLEA